MKIGELARRAGATVKAVRYYEAMGLVSPARLANGYRDYGEHDVRLVREIRTLGALGIPVDRTRPFLDCLAAGGTHGDDCPAALAGYREAIGELTARIEALAERRAVLSAHLREAAYRNSTATGAGAAGEEGAAVEEGAAGEGEAVHDLAVLPERLRLPFAMLSDPSLSLASALGLPVFEFDGRSLFRRITLVVREGLIEHVFYPVFPPDGHARQVVEWLRENPVRDCETVHDPV
ncbi:MerR family transcriptional regulator [Streptomyces sp. NPDC086023]|uniref:MerR family transcriptional regulator n=1 Tax=Streptomyces sp. NPDC086023 TaxID=3365746 RepID=UPI0037CDB6A1